MVDEILKQLSPQFNKMYAKVGRRRRTTRHTGYAISQKKRKRIEECFGWLKTIALLHKVRHRGTLKVDWIFTFACAAYNLVRMRNLMTGTVPAQ
jgi:Transposase DDE domain